MEMTMLHNGIEKSEQTTFAFGYSMKGQPDQWHSVTQELDILTLPIREPYFEIMAGDEHPEAPSFMRDYANMVRCMAGSCALMGGAKIVIQDGGKYRAVPSAMRFAPGRRPGSRLTYRQPYILISTALTPFRPTPSQVRKMTGNPVDSTGRPVTNLIGAEEVLRQIGVWAVHEADRIWPGDKNTSTWSDRVWQSLREDQDPSRMTPDVDPNEEILDAFVEFVLVYLRNAALARNAVMDDVPFHTHEFARIATGMFAREIAEHGDQLWDR